MSLGVLVDVMRALDGADDGRRAAPPGVVSTLAIRLLRDAASRGVPIPVAMRLWATLARKLPRARPAERAEALGQVIAALAPFEDWAAAATLLKLVVAEKQLAAPALAAELGAFLGRLRERRADLYQGVALLSRAQATAGEVPSNLELLRAAARLEGAS